MIITAKIASRYDDLFLLNEHSELCFYRINFYTQIIAFQSEQAEKKYTDGKKVQLKERKKLVIQGRKLSLWKQWLEARFESV